MNRAHLDEDTFPVFNQAFVARVHSRRRRAERKVAPASDETSQREQRIRRALRQGLSYGTPVKRIIAYIAAKHGFTYSEVLAPLRSREMVACRVEAMQEVKRLKPDMSLPQIGREFRRDHTTVLWALRKGERAAA